MLISNFVILFHEKRINDGKTSPSSLIEFYLIDEFFSLPLCGDGWLLNDDWLLPSCPKKESALYIKLSVKASLPYFAFSSRAAQWPHSFGWENDFSVFGGRIRENTQLGTH
jgi:hypothetical protein